MSALECPCCGDEAAVGEVSDGDALICGCPGYVSVDAEDAYVVIDDTVPCVPCALRERIAELEAENEGLRKILWLYHGCPSSVLYGDDGEMQCSRCFADFKRMSTDELSTMLTAKLIIAAIEEARR